MSHAQQVRLYGVTEGKGQPIAGVMIMAFEDNHFYKKIITDKKGSFRFNVGGRSYIILFYKPGMEPTVYHIINKMESDILKIPVNMEMTPTTLSPDTLLTQSPLFTQNTPEVSAAYIKAIYDYDHRRDTVSGSTCVASGLLSVFAFPVSSITDHLLESSAG